MRILVVPTEFPTIQEAVDSAQSGDEVLVLEGFYNESVVIGIDNLTLRGSQFPVEILGSGSGFGITVEANDTKLINLDIKNFLVGIAFRGNNYLLDEVISDENIEFGIVIFGDDGVIRNGSFSNNGIAGIVVSGKNDKIINNRINNNVEVGFGSFYSPLENAFICDNTILSASSADIQKKSIGISFNLKSSTNNLVQNNTISSNIGIISNGDNNIFKNNILLSSSRAAIILASNCNEIEGNTISQCPNGIIVNGNKNTISKNVFSIIDAIGITLSQEKNCVDNNLFIKTPIGIAIVDKNSVCYNKFVNVCEDVVHLETMNYFD